MSGGGRGRGAGAGVVEGAPSPVEGGAVEATQRQHKGSAAPPAVEAVQGEGVEGAGVVEAAQGAGVEGCGCGCAVEGGGVVEGAALCLSLTLF